VRVTAEEDEGVEEESTEEMYWSCWNKMTGRPAVEEEAEGDDHRERQTSADDCMSSRRVWFKAM
jgi:hypothetical protein